METIVQTVLEDRKVESDLSKSTKVHKDVDLDIDVGILLASDYNTLDKKAFR